MSKEQTEMKTGTCTGCGDTDTVINSNGTCLHCQLVTLSNHESGKLMAKALVKALHQIDNLVASYVEKINLAYLKSEDSAVKIGLTIDLSSKRTGRIDVKTGIAFVESKVKDETEGFVMEGQEEMQL